MKSETINTKQKKIKMTNKEWTLLGEQKGWLDKKTKIEDKTLKFATNNIRQKQHISDTIKIINDLENYQTNLNAFIMYHSKFFTHADSQIIQTRDLLHHLINSMHNII